MVQQEADTLVLWTGWFTRKTYLQKPVRNLENSQTNGSNSEEDRKKENREEIKGKYQEEKPFNSRPG